VARGKHANYPDQARCEDGGGFDTDSCNGNTVDTRMQFTFSRNVGSAVHHVLDCTPASPAMQYYRGGVECYWDGYSATQSPPPERFFGWWDPGSNPYAGGASAYGPVLRDLFEVTWLPATPILP
jgi:hypothetical protein